MDEPQQVVAGQTTPMFQRIHCSLDVIGKSLLLARHTTIQYKSICSAHVYAQIYVYVYMLIFISYAM